MLHKEKLKSDTKLSKSTVGNDGYSRRRRSLMAAGVICIFRGIYPAAMLGKKALHGAFGRSKHLKRKKVKVKVLMSGRNCYW